MAVAEERSFTRGAARLFLAQSGLSATIRALERELRAQLLVRTTRHVDLTPAGQALLREARRTLASARAATDAVAAVEGLRHGAVALGTMQASSFIDLPALLIRYRDAYPGIEFKLQQASAAELGRMLQDHILDLIFTTQANETPAEILSMPLVQSPVIVACRADHPLAAKKTIELKLLAEQSLVSFPPGWGVRDLADQAMQSVGLRPRYAYEVNDTTTVLDLLQAGCGVGVMPRVIAELRPDLRCITIKGPQQTWTISAQMLAPASPNPAARALWALLSSLEDLTRGALRRSDLSL